MTFSQEKFTTTVIAREQCLMAKIDSSQKSDISHTNFAMNVQNLKKGPTTKQRKKKEIQKYKWLIDIHLPTSLLLVFFFSRR